MENEDTNKTVETEEPVLSPVEDEPVIEIPIVNSETKEEQPKKEETTQVVEQPPVVEEVKEEPIVKQPPIVEEKQEEVVVEQPKLSKKEQQALEKKQKEEERKRLQEEEKQRIEEEKRKKEEERLALKQKKIEDKKAFQEKKRQIKEEKKLQDIRNHAPFFRVLLILAVIVMAGYSFYSNRLYQNTINYLKNKCTPFSLYEEETNLDLDSTLIKSLYSKVYTSMKEDYAQPEWNDLMKLYLAYRQIGDGDKYESNCNMFNSGSMEPYVCDESNNFTPLAFHQDTLILEYKKLFGENTPIKLQNIKLTNSCIGGYQYIPEREEFVQGRCTQQQTINYKVTKTLKEAIAKRDTIVLVEEVRYKEGESMELPKYLKNGKYYYTFRLDMNYNFILVSKKYEDEY